MGYRSQVVLAISKHLIPFLMLKVSQNKEAEALVFNHADEFDRDYQGDKSWLIRFDAIKWYEGYEDIEKINQFIKRRPPTNTSLRLTAGRKPPVSISGL